MGTCPLLRLWPQQGMVRQSVHCQGQDLFLAGGLRHRFRGPRFRPVLGQLQQNRWPVWGGFRLDLSKGLASALKP